MEWAPTIDFPLACLLLSRGMRWEGSFTHLIRQEAVNLGYCTVERNNREAMIRLRFGYEGKHRNVEEDERRS